MRKWQNVIDRERRRITASSIGSSNWRQLYDLARFQRGVFYQNHAADNASPEALIRAMAFAHVLQNVPLEFYQADEICGDISWRVADLPADITPAAYEAAMTAHQAHPQRNFNVGNDHTLPDYPTLLELGIGGIIARAENVMNNTTDQESHDYLVAMLTTLHDFSDFILRYAELAAASGDTEAAERLRHISVKPPDTLHQAIQLLWLTHLALASEQRGHNAFGRVDQYLLPFYRRDLAVGRLDRAKALELFCHWWSKIEGMHEVTNICIGGLTPDGRDATNELSYIVLEATALVMSPSTNISARLHDGTPEEFHRACARTIFTGIGFPAIFNDHVTIPALEKIGIPSEVARDHCMVGCIETMFPGRQQAWSDSRFNLPLYFSRALDQLRNEPERNFEHLMRIFDANIRQGLDAHIKWYNSELEKFPANRFPDPFLSSLTRDCIGRAKDINAGGAEFARFHGIAGMGLGTISDSVAAVKKLVFEEKKIDFDTLMKALDNDFAAAEDLRLTLLNHAPKYGNDDPYVDRIAAEVAALFCRVTLEYHTLDGGRFLPLLGANIQNISAGKEIKATPDGRHAGEPVSDAASPAFGRDATGPTAFIGSVSNPDYTLVPGGSVVNMRFSPDFFQGEEGITRFTAFTRTFVKRRIQELQFNFNSNETLHEALKNPEKFRNLVVRVSGFSAYFVTLMPEVQHDVIRRHAHGE